MTKGTLILLLVLIAETVFGLDVTRMNLEYQYDVGADLSFIHRKVSHGDSLFIFFQVKMDTSRKWTMDLLKQKGYASETHDTLKVYVIDSIDVSRNISRFRLKMIVPKNQDLLLFVFSDDIIGRKMIFDVTLNGGSGVPSFYPIDESGFPIVTSYVTTPEVSFSSKKSLYVYEYGDQFVGADPAMGQMKPISPTLDIDSGYVFKQTLNNLVNGKFYLVQDDSLSSEGFALLKVPAYFPEMKRIEELIGPLRYITTDDENKMLNSGSDKKANFENFWINTYSTKFRAKGAIRSFYHQVENSNLLFTDYKAGWKTDRGIIYIVFGKPDIVSRTANSEVWKYTNGIEFEFIRISTLFAPSLYSLKRDKKYEEIWYNRVGIIRKG
jgi:GWxTD domain-containing protein